MAEPMDLEDAPRTPMAVDVLHIINEARMTYGLRHQDYQRYRKHCAHRIGRLRNLLHIGQDVTKKNAQRKEIPDNVNDKRYLELYIYEAERAWATAMELKLEAESSMGTRKKHHFTQKLKKAGQHADALYSLCQRQSVDSITVLNAKAYAMTMKGYYYIEKKQWQDALDQCVSSRSLYESLAQTSSNAHQEALYYSAIDTLDPNIRFCAYKLQLDTSSQDIDAIAKHIKPVTGMETLEAELAKVKKSSAQQTDRLSQIEWRSKTLSVKSKSLADPIQKAREAVDHYEGLSEKEKNSVESFDPILSHWAEAEKQAKKAIKENKEVSAKVTSSKSVQASEELVWTQAFVIYNLYARSIQRNLVLVDELKAMRGKERELIKLYDDILKNVDSIRDLNVVQEDAAFDLELDTLEHFYKAHRCVHVARIYAEKAMTPEALSLYQRSQLYVVQAKQGLQQLGSFPKDAILKISEGQMSSLEQTIRTGTHKAHAAWYLEHPTDSEGYEDELTHKMDHLNLDKHGEIALINRLGVYPATLANPSSVPHLIDFPPLFEPVACKPLYFDLAANQIKYPSALTERADKPASKLWGFFGFGGK
ncbi:hypothetical protein CLU79DRAFT_744588 [Phycomyces nitens]|nr:hypothetical protein CLU79DRAFT_744588 [Phycomyces nitens]